MLRPALPALSALVALGFSSHSFAAPVQQDLPDQSSTVSSAQPASESGNSASGAVALEGLSINADYGIAGQATTESTGSYTTGAMNTATKLPLSRRRSR
jgi:outer membrane receptor for ferric coprogen and ferric-rhodotorulic acid